MASKILGWILVIIGILAFLTGLATFIQAQFALPGLQTLPEFQNPDLKVIAELLAQIAAILKEFARLTVPVQWALMGLVSIGLGTFLLAKKPF
jgi:hypothetical protein